MNKTSRTVSPKSEYNKRMDRIGMERGGFPNDRKPWTNEANDALLNGFLLGLFYLSKRVDLYTLTGRTFSGVWSQLWKLGSNYKPEDSIYNYAEHYQPQSRNDRSGTPFTDRDRVVMAWATDDNGLRYRAYKPGLLAKLLARTPEEIGSFMEALVKEPVEGFFPRLTNPNETSEQKLAREVNDRLDKFKDKIKYSLGGYP